MTEPLPQAVLPEHLTDALRRSGVLGVNTCVSEATVESSRATILSRIIRLRLRYDGLSENAPPTVILKTGLPERAGGGWNAGRQEVAFYQQVAGAVAPPATPRCFEAHWNPKSEAWHLLLEDLTDTHLIATAWPLPPTVTQCQRIIEARARFQAVLWDDQRLGKSLGKWLDTEGYLQRFADAFTRFADRFGEQVPAERRRIYEQLLAAAPHLFSRYLSRRHLTIVQGDAHVWNCFLARDDSAEKRIHDAGVIPITMGSDSSISLPLTSRRCHPDMREWSPRILMRIPTATAMTPMTSTMRQRNLRTPLRNNAHCHITVVSHRHPRHDLRPSERDRLAA